MRYWEEFICGRWLGIGALCELVKLPSLEVLQRCVDVVLQGLKICDP